MGIIYRYMFFSSPKWEEIQKITSELSKRNIRYKVKTVSEQYVSAHSDTAAGTEVLGRSVRAQTPLSKDEHKYYAVYIKPKDIDNATHSPGVL